MQELAGIIVAFIPILAVLILANLGQRQRERDEPSGVPTALAYGLLVVLYGTGILIGIGLHLAGLLMAQQPNLLAEFMSGMDEAVFDSLPLLAAGLWAPSLAGILLLLRPVRSALSRLIPIDADSPVDAVALSLSMLIVINLMTTLGVGLDNVADLIEAAGDGEDGAATMAALWGQQLLMLLTAAIGVGWLTRRPLAAAMERLGVVAPTVRQSLIGLGVGLVAVPAVLLLEYVASLTGLQPDPDVERLTEELLGAMLESPWGIMTLGLAAAVGEEPLFRGAAQPRFGLFLTALLFALVHSNYGITLSTVIVFFLGLALGYLRIRHNTTTAMFAHAAYNIGLGLLAYFSIPFLEP